MLQWFAKSGAYIMLAMGVIDAVNGLAQLYVRHGWAGIAWFAFASFCFWMGVALFNWTVEHAQDRHFANPEHVVCPRCGMTWVMEHDGRIPNCPRCGLPEPE